MTEPSLLRQTIQSIKDLILARRLRPGDALPTEGELSDLLGVSRSNLREAVRTLVALDILDVRPGKATFVGNLSLRPLVEGLTFKATLLPGDSFDAVREIVEVRIALDLALAPAVVERMAGRPVAALQSACDEMRAANQRDQDFEAADRLFHLLVAEQLQNSLYGELVAAFWDIYTLVSPRLGLASARDNVGTAAAHQELLDAAVDGDLARYVDALHDHYRPVSWLLGTSWPPQTSLGSEYVRPPPGSDC